MGNPYEVLEVAPDATPEQIHVAYKRLVKELHPDKYSDSPYRVQNEEWLKKVNAAYDKLKKDFSVGVGLNAKGGVQCRTEEAPRQKTAYKAKRGGDSDAESAAARFWEAFHKAEDGLK